MRNQCLFPKEVPVYESSASFQNSRHVYERSASDARRYVYVTSACLRKQPHFPDPPSLYESSASFHPHFPNPANSPQAKFLQNIPLQILAAYNITQLLVYISRIDGNCFA